MEFDNTRIPFPLKLHIILNNTTCMSVYNIIIIDVRNEKL